jgi:hypothetical protein
LYVFYKTETIVPQYGTNGEGNRRVMPSQLHVEAIALLDGGASLPVRTQLSCECVDDRCLLADAKAMLRVLSFKAEQ